MFDTILLPVDFSEPSARAARYAGAIALHTHSSLQIATVIPSLEAGADRTPLLRQFMADSAEESIHALGFTTFPEDRISWKTIINDSVSNAILEYSASPKVGLVVMGTHGRSGLSALLLGSVTEKVMRNIRKPLLVVGRGKDLLTNVSHLPARILIATDFSEASKAALQQAVRLAQLWEASLVIVHVVEIAMTVPYTPLGVGPVFSSDSEAMNEARANLHDFVEQNVPENLPCDWIVAEGEPAQRIEEIVNEQNVEMVIVGTRGHTKLERWFLGSTSERLLQKCSVAVWVQPLLP
ncbi:MAG: universal stress protein [bacterium]|nr:universal stress protein [bacterium]